METKRKNNPTSLPNDSGTWKWNMRRCQELQIVNFVNTVESTEPQGRCGVPNT